MSRTGWGVVWALGGYLVYALHYATMKGLHASYDIFQLIFIRSAVMLALTLAFGGGLGEFLKSRRKISTGIRGFFQFLSVPCFFLAATTMQLANVTTIYSSAPLMIVGLSIIFLGERPNLLQYIAIAIGLLGTVTAANPSGEMQLIPVAAAFGSAFFWALIVVLTRADEITSTRVQMISMALVCIACSAVMMDWRWPANLQDTLIMAALGLQIAIAQVCFFEACRRAPASLVGPLEYSTLIWVVIFGVIFFAEVPTPQTLAGMALVVLGGIGLIWKPRQRRSVSA